VIRWESMMSIESEHEVAETQGANSRMTRAPMCVYAVYTIQIMS
jgi:hypothetical protein